jgi:hypothetical protein
MAIASLAKARLAIASGVMCNESWVPYTVGKVSEADGLAKPYQKPRKPPKTTKPRPHSATMRALDALQLRIRHRMLSNTIATHSDQRISFSGAALRYAPPPLLGFSPGYPRKDVAYAAEKLQDCEY